MLWIIHKNIAKEVLLAAELIWARVAFNGAMWREEEGIFGVWVDVKVLDDEVHEMRLQLSTCAAAVFSFHDAMFIRRLSSWDKNSINFLAYGSFILLV